MRFAEKCDEEFWKIIDMYVDWSISKKNDENMRTLTLKNVHKQDIIFEYDPDFIDEKTIRALKKKIDDASMDFWGF